MRSDTLNLPIAVTIRNTPANQDPIVLGWLEALDVNSAAWPHPSDGQYAEYGYRGRQRLQGRALRTQNREGAMQGYVGAEGNGI